jgi:hypothetical protein
MLDEIASVLDSISSDRDCRLEPELVELERRLAHA